MPNLSRFKFATACMMAVLGCVYNAEASDDCAQWPVSKLKELTFRAMASQNASSDKPKLAPDELEVVEKTVLFSPASPGWYIEFKVLRPNPSKPIFISLVSCTGHVEFGSRNLRPKEISK